MLIAEAQPASLAGVLHPLLAPIMRAHRGAVRVGVGFEPGMMCLHIRELRDAGPAVAHLIEVGVQGAVVAAERFATVDTHPDRIATTGTSEESAT